MVAMKYIFKARYQTDRNWIACEVAASQCLIQYFIAMRLFRRASYVAHRSDVVIERWCSMHIHNQSSSKPNRRAIATCQIASMPLNYIVLASTEVSAMSVRKRTYSFPAARIV
jgi:hypothetical protein